MSLRLLFFLILPNFLPKSSSAFCLQLPSSAWPAAGCGTREWGERRNFFLMRSSASSSSSSSSRNSSATERGLDASSSRIGGSFTELELDVIKRLSEPDDGRGRGQRRSDVPSFMKSLPPQSKLLRAYKLLLDLYGEEGAIDAVAKKPDLLLVKGTHCLFRLFWAP